MRARNLVSKRLPTRLRLTRRQPNNGAAAAGLDVTAMYDRVMRIRAIHVRRFRSLHATSVHSCGGLNVLIGKNNAGKSSILAALDLALTHLRTGRLAKAWDTTRRAQDEFYNRDSAAPLQIGLEFELPTTLNEELRAELRSDAPQLERAVAELTSLDVLSVIIAGASDRDQSFLAVEAIGLGGIEASGGNLQLAGKSILTISAAAARELFDIDREVSTLRADATALEQATEEIPFASYKADSERLRFLLARSSYDRLTALMPVIAQQLKSAESAEEFARAMGRLASDTRAKADAADQRKTNEPLLAYAGEVHAAPPYALWVMRRCGGTRLLHFRENKAPIGQDEAAALLKLKVRRGGEQTLQAVRQTVQSLLGVSVDAFEPDEASAERPRRRGYAEMDIDNFILEANGSGIREALRLILDIELKAPDLVLVEEPEIHLHPGLEHAMHGYLRSKSEQVQFFITTHSTNFVDTGALQNVYMVARDAARRTSCSALLLDQSLERIPSELGLRLSTVFMFDRLVFVEGKSDEDVLRELARRLGLDLTAANVGFVQMGGVQNFAHYAAEGTLDLLCRRQVKMFFVVDRDEREDAEVRALIDRLGARASLVVLSRRELDNYLMTPRAICALIAEKLRLGVASGNMPTEDAVSAALEAAIDSLQGEVVRLRHEREFLRPVHLQGRKQKGSVGERLEQAIADLQARRERADTASAETKDTVEKEWSSRRRELAPGSLALDLTLKNVAGLRYSKTADGPRLARALEPGDVDREIYQLLCGAVGVAPRNY